MANLKLNSVTLATESAGTVSLASGTDLSNSAIVYPSGHVVGSKILAKDIPSTCPHISTGNDAFTDTDIAGSFTTVVSSADSYLVFEFHTGMSHISASASWGTTTLTLKSSDTTTYATDDDIISTASPTGAYRNRFGGWPHADTYIHQRMRFIYHAGDLQYPSNLTSYTAGQTLYARLYMAEPSGATFYLVHSSSYYNFTVQEIMR